MFWQELAAITHDRIWNASSLLQKDVPKGYKWASFGICWSTFLPHQNFLELVGSMMTNQTWWSHGSTSKRAKSGSLLPKQHYRHLSRVCTQWSPTMKSKSLSYCFTTLVVMVKENQGPERSLSSVIHLFFQVLISGSFGNLINKRLHYCFLSGWARCNIESHWKDVILPTIS